MSSGSSDSSGTSTDVSGETIPITGAHGRRPQFNIRLSNISGNVAVGPRSAKIIHQKADENRTLANGSHCQGASCSAKREIQVGEPASGSYCVYRYSRLHYEEREGESNPEPSKGILLNDGHEECQWSIESFYENPDRFIQTMDKSSNLCKEQLEQFVLLILLPHLEESWGKCSSKNKEVYEILTKLSCSLNSDTVVKHSLQLLLHLTCRGHFGIDNGGLVVLEEIMRSSIFPFEGMFRKDKHSERNLKLFCYSQVLSLLLMQQILQDGMPILDQEKDLKRVHKELKSHYDQIKSKRKDDLRYSMETTLVTNSHLQKPNNNSPIAARLKKFVEECQEFCGNSRKESKDLDILRSLKQRKKNGEWIDLHCILIHLHGKVHSERPVPQMETERRAMTLIRLIVEAYLQGEGGADWRFCLFAASLLVEIAKNNVTKEMRKEAGGCLLNLLRDEKVHKTPECRAILQRRSSELLFCPDRETRTIFIHFLSKNRNLEDALPANLHIEHLSSMYRTQTLEINDTTIRQTSSCFINHGMFQSRKVAVKVLYVKQHHLLEEDPKFDARERLVREASNMRRLNASQHPNFPVLLGYDTVSFPYHLITAFEKFGNLLQFVRMSREREPHLKPTQLLKILGDVSGALLHLEEFGLVHRAVMAENVLVGENYVCKLTGLHTMCQLNRGSINQANPALLNGITFNDEDLRIRWKAPECLKEHLYSTPSDVWAFGVLMYEVLTLGCTPYRHVVENKEVPYHVLDNKEIVPKEFCFENGEYELIKQCCEWRSSRRPRLNEVNKTLQDISHLAEDRSRPDPPPLEMQLIGCNSSSVQLGEEFYSSISEEETSRSDPPPLEVHTNNERTTPEDQSLTAVNDLPTRTKVEGLSVVLEKVSVSGKNMENIGHLRGLVRLQNPHLASVRNVFYGNSNYMVLETVLPEDYCGNLKDYVVDGRCNEGHIVTFLSQVASALHYLHINHIVHGDLRAEHVNVVAPKKVEVGRFGRSKPLYVTADEVTSTCCTAEAVMSPNTERWSAPEVILEGRFSHSSDVWAFGILAWELYESLLASGQDRRKMSVPYHFLQNDKILPYMRDKRPLERPKGCPEWVYNIMHQCWTYDSVQRPPFLAIVDCLTSREPMSSWMMELWKRNHDQSKWTELSIRQSDDACHVTDAKDHPSKEDMEMMCSEGFFLKHHYKYVDQSTINVGEEEYYASCSSEGSLDETKVFDRSSGYHEPYSGRSLKRNGALLSSEKRGGKSSKSNVSKRHSLNGHLALQIHSASRNVAPLESNDEASEVVEETYDDIPVGMAGPLNNEAASNTCLGAECHNNGENVTNTLFYSCASFSGRKGSVDTKGRSYKGDIIRRCDSVTRNHDAKEQEDYNEVSNVSGYSEPVEMKGGEVIENKHHLCDENKAETLFYSSEDVSRCNRPLSTKQRPGSCSTISHSLTKGTNTALSSSNEKTYCHPYSGEIEDDYEEPSIISCHSPPTKMQCDKNEGTKLPRSDVTIETLSYASTGVSACSTTCEIEDGYEEPSIISCHSPPTKMQCDKNEGTKLPRSDVTIKTLSYASTGVSACSTTYEIEDDYEEPSIISCHSPPTKMQCGKNEGTKLPRSDVTIKTLSYASTGVSACSTTYEIEDDYEEPSIISCHSPPTKMQCGKNEGTKLPRSDVTIKTLSYASTGVSACSTTCEIEVGYEEPSIISCHSPPTKMQCGKNEGTKLPRSDVTIKTLSYASTGVSACSTTCEIEEGYEEPSFISCHSPPTKMQCGKNEGTKLPRSDVTIETRSYTSTGVSACSTTCEIEEGYEEPSITSSHLPPMEMQCGKDETIKLPCGDATTKPLFYAFAGISCCSKTHEKTIDRSINSSPNFQACSEKLNEGQSAANKKLHCSLSTEHTEGENDEESTHISAHLLPIQGNGIGGNDTKRHPHTSSRDVGVCEISEDPEVTNETPQHSSGDVAGCRRPYSDIYQASHSFRTDKEDPYFHLNQERNYYVEYEYETLDFSRDRHGSLLSEDTAHLNGYQNTLERKSDEDDSSLYDDVIGCTSGDGTHLEQFVRDKTCLNEYQNMAYQSDEDEYDDVIGFITDDNTRFEQFSNGDGAVTEYQNMAHKLNGSDCAMYNKPMAITKDNTDLGAYQHTASKLKQNDSSVYDKLQHGKDDSAPLRKFKHQSSDREPFTYQHLVYLETIPFRVSHTEGQPSTTQETQDKKKEKSYPRNKESVGKVSGLHHYEEEYESMPSIDNVPLNANDITHNFKLQSRDAEPCTYQNLEHLQTTPFSTSHTEGQMSTAPGTQAKSTKTSQLRNNESVRTFSGLHDVKQRDEYEAECESMARIHIVSPNVNDTTLNFDVLSRDAEPCSYQNLEQLQTVPFSTSQTKGETSTAPGIEAKRKKESHLRNKESKGKASALRHVRQRDKYVSTNIHTKNGTRYSSIGGVYRHTKDIDGARHSSIGGTYKRQEGIRLDHEATLTAAKHDTRLRQRRQSASSRVQLDDPNLDVIYF